MAGWTLYPRGAGEILRVLAGTGAWKGISHQPPSVPTPVPGHFFGVNVAGSPEAGGNQYVLDRLGELGLRHVRMDLRCGDEHPWQIELAHALMQQGYGVMVRLVQPIEDAQAMQSPEGVERWRAFIERVGAALDCTQLEAIEIGAVPNRRKWSGYSHAGYLAAWRAASERLDGVRLAGPNVSDFEPLHTLLLLKEMARMKRSPDIHTVNLFVERVREPEAFDHRVLGEKMTDRLKLNLVKKAGIYAAMGARYGAAETMCTHTCWNAIRIVRWTEDIERVRAAYLQRYLILAAASGALSRVYWGPLIGHSDGLIDDGTAIVDPQERVAYYERSPGRPADYVPTPAFAAYRQIIDLLAGSACVSGHADPAGPFEFVFESEDKPAVYARWQRDADLAGEPVRFALS